MSLIEILEERRLMSASAWQVTQGPNDWTQVFNGVEVRYSESFSEGRPGLLISGTDGNDTLTAAADVDHAGRWRLTLNGDVHTIDLPEGARNNMFVGLAGGGGNDTLRANFPYELQQRTISVYMYGGEGNDTLLGGEGSYNTLYGDAGNDRLEGGESYDRLFGGTGADTLLGFGGIDELWGNTAGTVGGSDAGDSLDSGGSFFDSENGVRHINYEIPTLDAPQEWTITRNGIEVRFGRYANTNFYNPSIVDHTFGITITGTAGDDQIIFQPIAGEASKVHMLLNGAVETIDFANEMQGMDYGGMVIDVGDGDDYVYLDPTLNFSDLLDTGPNEPIYAVRVLGGHGNDVLVGSAGRDWLEGDNNDGIFDDGADLLIGNAGGDLLHGTAGDDRMYGGAGNDQIDMYWSEGPDSGYVIHRPTPLAAVGGTGEDYVLQQFDPFDEDVEEAFVAPPACPLDIEPEDPQDAAQPSSAAPLMPTPVAAFSSNDDDDDAADDARLVELV